MILSKTRLSIFFFFLLVVFDFVDFWFMLPSCFPSQGGGLGYWFQFFPSLVTSITLTNFPWTNVFSVAYIFLLLKVDFFIPYNSEYVFPRSSSPSLPSLLSLPCYRTNRRHKDNNKTNKQSGTGQDKLTNRRQWAEDTAWEIRVDTEARTIALRNLIKMLHRKPSYL